MSDDRVWCPRCELEYPGAGFFCPRHLGAELITRPSVAAAPGPERVRPEGNNELTDAVCWNCGTGSTNIRNDTCVRCYESLVRPALVIQFPAGRVVVRRRQTSAELGRSGEYRQIFAYPNVSRRHASVSVDEAGDAWLTPYPEAPNGTFVNNQEIFRRTQIRPGDQIRFATDQAPNPGPVSDSVRLPQRESTDRAQE